VATERGRDREFHYPVPGFRTYRDAAQHILKPPRKVHDEPQWQFAMEVLINAAERGGEWTPMAHMAMLKALNHGKPQPGVTPRCKAYKIVR
jgi:hypothetical protein